MMNPYTLRFLDNQLEEQYQEARIRQVLRRIFQIVVLGTFLLHGMKIIYDLALDKPNKPYINIGFIVWTIIAQITIKINKKLIKLVITISNISTLVLQMNFDTSYSLPQDYYQFGCNITQLQSVLYFLSDFLYATVSVIFHTVARMVITSYYTQRVDIQDYCFSILCVAFVVSILYKNDINSRKHFLLRLKEEQIDDKLIKFVKSPFFQFDIKCDLQQINLQQAKHIEQFQYGREDFCDGCNFRNLLRDIFIDKNTTLEQQLLKNHDQEQNYNVKYIHNHQKMSIDIYFCNLGIEYSKYILILQNIKTNNLIRKVQTFSIEDAWTQIKAQIKRVSQQNFNLRIFYFGVLSTIKINDTMIHQLNLKKQFKKFSKLLKCKGFIDIKGENQINVQTYGNQLNIWIIQVLLIIQQITINRKQKSYIFLEMQEDVILIKFILKDPSSFVVNYYRNFFIKQISSQLLYNNLNSKLELNLIKNIQQAFNII
ncbi:unnamed protein product [Paramecium pentaurelia]|uniref:Transmembrane protein n=1 Tax=Paramecium pentaurelia TaxID=43138 RepID=A0A8S1TH18_9CILI|nr:unnamed protein product [Paramecium pentaurelia]